MVWRYTYIVWIHIYFIGAPLAPATPGAGPLPMAGLKGDPPIAPASPAVKPKGPARPAPKGEAA